ncbi:MAG TPA: proline dehydrogenase family protein [Chloroflexota bacterium]|nr:proline dehydrogenase family protein [Chloroflexota bacterium]
MAGSLFSRLILAAANQPAVAATATASPITRGLVRRFVAGEALDEALAVAQSLGDGGFTVAMAYLGENTASAAEADAATDEALRVLDAISSRGLDPYISVKPTQLGLDVGRHVAVSNAVRLLEHARALRAFVRLDMESSSYTSAIIEVFSELRPRFDNVGIVLQASLYRTRADLEAITRLGGQVRLCKGAYSEPPHIAYRRKRDTDRNFVRLMEYLLRQDAQPAIATHDPAIIDHARDFARVHGIGVDRFEFQMLYGVRRDLQEQLARAGYRVRIYLPYGAQWYPYLTRRLAERPANLWFLVGNLIRERRPPS